MVAENKKYNNLFATAKDLFWKYGVKRVSVEEICQKANVSKMTFYKFFPNKVELAKTIFDRVVEEGQLKMRKIMNDDSPASEKIKRIILLKMEGTKDISPEFVNDFYTGAEPELQDYVKKRRLELWNVLLDDFREAQEAGIFRKDFKPEFVFKVQNKLFEMLEDESVISMYESKQELIMAFTNFLMYGVAPHD